MFFDVSDYLDLQKIDPLSMLHPKMLSIIIFLLFSFKKKDFLIDEKGSKCKISETDYNWFNGEIELSNGKFSKNIKLTYKNIKLDGNFFENRFLSGEITAYYENSKYKLYEIKYKSNKDFHVKLYGMKKGTCTGNLIVDAEYKNTTFDVGFLILKRGEELWEGTVKRNQHNFEMLNGIVHHRLVEDSRYNYNYDAEEKRIEEQLEKENYTEYMESLINEFDKEESTGYKVYEDFIYENGKVIERKNSTTEYQYEE